MAKPGHNISVLPAFVDFEMTGLNANYSRFICGCVKPYGQPTMTFRIDQTAAGIERVYDDSQLAVELRDCLEDQWMIATWNGIMFDIKFLNARLLAAGERVLHKPLHKDLMFTAKSAIATSDHRLVTVQEFLKLDTSKTRLDPNEWIKAAAGDPGAIDYVVDHCEHDVAVLEEVFEHLLPFVKEIHA